MSSASRSSSRPSKSDRAGHREALNRPLTVNPGVSLRTEAIADHKDGLQPKSWGGTVRAWRDWYRDAEETQAVFENPEGDQVKGSDPSRFHPGYADKQYAKLKDLERGIQAEYGRRLHTAMLTLTASTTTEDGEPRPPVDHLLDLDSSWEAVRRELHRVLEGRRWEYLAILEPHDSGYIHAHVAVFVEGVITEDMFRPVIDAHIRNCPTAGREAHENAVSVKWAGGRDTDGDDHINNLAIYLAEYLGTYGESGLEAPENQQMANAVLWATGKQRWRPSNGAQQYMATNKKDEDSEWEMVGIEDATGEIHEVGENSGGVTKLKTLFPDSIIHHPDRGGPG